MTAVGRARGPEKNYLSAMAYVVLTLAAVGLAIYGLVDCWSSSDEEVQVLPKPLWMALLLVPLAGGLLWVTVGRTPGGWTAGPGRRALAPDDDPEFLRSLDAPGDPAQDPRRSSEPGPGRGPDPERTGQGKGDRSETDPRPSDQDPGTSPDRGPSQRNGGDTGESGPVLP